MSRDSVLVFVSMRTNDCFIAIEYTNTGAAAGCWYCHSLQGQACLGCEAVLQITWMQILLTGLESTARTSLLQPAQETAAVVSAALG
jgi:hypothetical protein